MAKIQYPKLTDGKVSVKIDKAGKFSVVENVSNLSMELWSALKKATKAGIDALEEKIADIQAVGNKLDEDLLVFLRKTATLSFQEQRDVFKVLENINKANAVSESIISQGSVLLQQLYGVQNIGSTEIKQRIGIVKIDRKQTNSSSKNRYYLPKVIIGKNETEDRDVAKFAVKKKKSSDTTRAYYNEVEVERVTQKSFKEFFDVLEKQYLDNAEMYKVVSDLKKSLQIKDTEALTDTNTINALMRTVFAPSTFYTQEEQATLKSRRVYKPSNNNNNNFSTLTTGETEETPKTTATPETPKIDKIKNITNNSGKVIGQIETYSNGVIINRYNDGRVELRKVGCRALDKDGTYVIPDDVTNIVGNVFDVFWYASPTKIIVSDSVKVIAWNAFNNCDKLKIVDMSAYKNASDLSFRGCDNLQQVILSQETLESNIKRELEDEDLEEGTPEYNKKFDELMNSDEIKFGERTYGVKLEGGVATLTSQKNKKESDVEKTTEETNFGVTNSLIIDGDEDTPENDETKITVIESDAIIDKDKTLDDADKTPGSPKIVRTRDIIEDSKVVGTEEFYSNGVVIYRYKSGSVHLVDVPDSAADKDGTYVVPDDITCMKESAFFSMGLTKEGVTKIVVPDSVDYIEDDAFDNCRNLKIVDMSAYKNTYNLSFRGCDNLQQVILSQETLESNIKRELEDEDLEEGTPEYNAKYNEKFNELMNSDEIKIGEQPYGLKVEGGVATLTSPHREKDDIEDKTIEDITPKTSTDGDGDTAETEEAPKIDKTRDITDDSGNVVGTEEFYSNGIVINRYNDGRVWLVKVPDSAADKDGTYVVPDDITRIGWLAFSLAGVTKIVVPDSVDHINGDAFNYCRDLKIVDMSAYKNACNLSFKECDNLQQVILSQETLESNIKRKLEDEDLEEGTPEYNEKFNELMNSDEIKFGGQPYGLKVEGGVATLTSPHSVKSTSSTGSTPPDGSSTLTGGAASASSTSSTSGTGSASTGGTTVIPPTSKTGGTPKRWGRTGKEKSLLKRFGAFVQAHWLGLLVAGGLITVGVLALLAVFAPASVPGLVAGAASFAAKVWASPNMYIALAALLAGTLGVTSAVTFKNRRARRKHELKAWKKQAKIQRRFRYKGGRVYGRIINLNNNKDYNSTRKVRKEVKAINKMSKVAEKSLKDMISELKGKKKEDARRSLINSKTRILPGIDRDSALNGNAVIKDTADSIKDSVDQNIKKLEDLKKYYETKKYSATRKRDKNQASEKAEEIEKALASMKKLEKAAETAHTNYADDTTVPDDIEAWETIRADRKSRRP